VLRISVNKREAPQSMLFLRHYLGDKVKEDMGGQITRTEDVKNAYRILVWKSEDRRPLARHIRK
jgi:hypothetical protein